ncbi:MAG: hypothetical protein ISR48_01710 [Alphaproteobacteria bacterium]|nr:hypothetical protein [Alphaproteobacteria bacterium]
MARAYGSSATLLMKRESAYGGQASGDYVRIPFNSCSLGSEQGLIDDPVLGQGRDPLAPLQDVINDEGDIVVPVDPRYLGFWLTGLLGDPTSNAVAASGYIDFATNPSDGDTITVGGTTWTFVSGVPSGNETQIQTTATQTIDQLITDLNGSVDVNIDDATYSRPASTQRLLLTHDTAGVSGNAFTLAASAAMAGGPALTGGGSSHVFVSGIDVLPSYSIEVGMAQVPAFFMHAGVVLNSITLEFQRSGAAAATINAIAQGETRNATTQGGTPTTLAFSRISQFQGSITKAGQPVGNLTSGSLTYSNNLEKIETIRSDGLIEGADPTVAALTGRIDVRFADTSLIDAAAGGTPVDLEFGYTIGSSKVLFTAHEVYLPKPKLAVDGPGGIQASFDFQGAKNDAAGRMLTVTLTNDLDGTVYL